MGYEKLIQVLRVHGIMVGTFALNAEVSIFKAFSYKLLWLLYAINGLLTTFALIMGIPYYRHDFLNIMKSITELTHVLETIFSVVYCRMRKEQLQMILLEMEQLDKIWTDYEVRKREEIVHRSRIVYIIMLAIYINGSIAFTILPILTSRLLPLNTIYPFPTTELWGRCVSYILNVLTIVQVSITVNLDLVVVTMLWDVAFKFNLLGMRMRSVSTIDELRVCIGIYQDLCTYVKEIDDTVSYMIAKVIGIVSLNVISCGLLILYKIPFTEGMPFYSITFMSIVRLYIQCRSAQTVTELAYEVNWHTYESSWMYKSAKVRRLMLMIMQICQKPVVISASSFIPVVCIHVCGKVLYRTFSYILALRAVLRV